MNNMNNIIKYIIYGCCLLFIYSCDDLLDVDLPKSEMSSATIFTSDETAEAAVNGMYQGLVSPTFYNYLHAVPGETSDELIPKLLAGNEYTENDIEVEDGNISSMWDNFYKVIYYANSIIEGLTDNTQVSAVNAQKFLGEAYFVRAFCYSYMVNIWGDVPMITQTDVEENAMMSRTSSIEVKKLIVADLEEAISKLPTSYSDYSNNKIRASKWAACALMARVKLYEENWADAEAYADSVIDESSLFQLVQNLDANNSPFLSNSSEAILQLPYYTVNYTYEGSSLFTSSGNYLLRNGNQLFDANDARLSNWTISIVAEDGNTYLAPYKYKNAYLSEPIERSTVFRLAEVYLIRAEARAKQNDLPGAVADLQVIRERALLTGSGATTDTDQSAVLASVVKERQRELFAEFGHRWFDLKRTNTIDATLSALSDKNWLATDAFYPVPERAIISNPNLKQNTGY